MTRIGQAGPPVLVVALIAGLFGYIIGCTREQRDRDAFGPTWLGAFGRAAPAGGRGPRADDAPQGPDAG